MGVPSPPTEGNAWFDKLELDILDREDGETIFEVTMSCFSTTILLDALVVVKLMPWLLNGSGASLFSKDQLIKLYSNMNVHSIKAYMIFGEIDFFQERVNLI